MITNKTTIQSSASVNTQSPLPSSVNSEFAFMGEDLFEQHPSSSLTQKNTKGAVARLLEYEWRRYVAVAPHTALEVIENPSFSPIPAAAYYIAGMLHWQQRWLPVVNLRALVNGKADDDALLPLKYVLVLAYQAQAGEPINYGAVTLHGLPKSLLVVDEQACELPESIPVWQQVAVSCFTYEREAVPIIDTGLLFAQSHVNALPKVG